MHPVGASYYHCNHHMSVGAVIDVLTVPASTPRTLYAALGWLGAAMLGSCVGLTGQARFLPPAQGHPVVRRHASCRGCGASSHDSTKDLTPPDRICLQTMCPSRRLSRSVTCSTHG